VKPDPMTVAAAVSDSTDLALSLQRIEQVQHTQCEMLEKLLHAPSQKKRPRSSISDEVETAFGHFVECLSSLSGEERVKKLRKLCTAHNTFVMELADNLPESGTSAATSTPIALNQSATIARFNVVDLPTFINEWSTPVTGNIDTNSLDGNTSLGSSGSWLFAEKN